MAVLRILNLHYLKHLLALVLVILLSACAGGAGGAGGAADGVLSPVASGGGFDTSINISWEAPVLRSDGATWLDATEISSYRIYFGVKSGEYLGYLDIAGAANTTANVQGLPPGTYYMVIVTLDTEGRESLYSAEVVKTA